MNLNAEYNPTFGQVESRAKLGYISPPRATNSLQDSIGPSYYADSSRVLESRVKLGHLDPARDSHKPVQNLNDQHILPSKKNLEF